MRRIIISNEIKEAYLEKIFKKEIYLDIKKKNFVNIEKFFIIDNFKDSHKNFCEIISTKLLWNCVERENKCTKLFYLIFFSNDLEKLKKIKINSLTKNDIKKHYDNFRKRWGRIIVELTNVKVCPYCNRNYVFNYNENKTTMELDHFLPLSKYPHLALNLYNLIPVCRICNNEKKEKTLNIYPFKENIDDYFKFKFKFINNEMSKEDIKKYSFFDEKFIEIEIEETILLDEWYKKYIKGLYAEHKDIVSEMLLREHIYPESFIQELYKNYGGILFNSIDEIQGLIHCNYVEKEKINKRPLSKLIKDISEELGII